MEPPVFYAPPESVRDSSIILRKDESHHAVKVMRMSTGALVIVVDGLGMAYRGEIARIDRDQGVEVKIHSQVRNFGEPGVILTLAAGLSTGFKFDSVVEAGTQLGVKRFVPLLTDKSKIHLDDPKRLRSKTTRYEKVALAAMKQCRRSYRPEISLPVSFVDYMKQIDSQTLNLIFHPSPDAHSLADLDVSGNPKRVNIVVGPEAGFSAAEMESGKRAGLTAVSMGGRILRTETAGPVICGLVMNLLGELR